MVARQVAYAQLSEGLVCLGMYDLWLADIDALEYKHEDLMIYATMHCNQFLELGHKSSKLQVSNGDITVLLSD